MKRREFIGEACKFAVLCSAPLALSTLQSCSDVENDNTDFVSDDDFIDVNKNFIEFNLNQAPFDKLKEINKKYEKLDKDHNEMENMLKKRIEELKEEVKHYESIYSDDELHFDCEESMYNYIECDGQYVVVEKEEYERLKEGK